MGKRKKNDDINVPDLMGKGITYVYLIVMMGVFPAFYPGHLIGIHSVKAGFFITAASIYLCLMLFVFVYSGISHIKERRKIEYDLGDIFAAVFLIAVVMSTVFGLDSQEAFWGNSRIKTGGLVLLLCVLSFFAVKRYAKPDRSLIRINLLASAFIYLSGILLTCKLDILNMQKDIVEEQKEIFVSSIGNINYNVSYISLILPAAMALFLFCRELADRRILAVYLFIGFMDMICLRTESAVAMLLFAFVLLLYFALEKPEWLTRYISVVLLFIGANVSVYVLKIALKGHMYDFDGLSAVLLKTETVAAEVLIGVLLFCFQRFAKGITEEKALRFQKRYRNLVLAAVSVGALFVLALNFFFGDYASGNALKNLILDDDFGNSRGYVYTRTVSLFSKLPFVNQIFGCGLGCFYDFIFPAYGEDMLARFNSVFYDPHNDLLHVLATTGFVGVIGFFGGIFTTLAASMKKRKNRKVQIMAVMSLAAFLVQGLVNSFTIFIIPLVFIIMGLAYSAPPESE